VWTLDIPTATDIDFDLDIYSLNPEIGDGVLITGFKYDGTDGSPWIHTHVL